VLLKLKWPWISFLWRDVMVLKSILLAAALSFMFSSAFADQCEDGSHVTITGQVKQMNKNNFGGYTISPSATSPCDLMAIFTKTDPPQECKKSGVTFRASGKLDYPTLDADSLSCK